MYSQICWLLVFTQVYVYIIASEVCAPVAAWIKLVDCINWYLENIVQNAMQTVIMACFPNYIALSPAHTVHCQLYAIYRGTY